MIARDHALDRAAREASARFLSCATGLDRDAIIRAVALLIATDLKTSPPDCEAEIWAEVWRKNRWPDPLLLHVEGTA